MRPPPLITSFQFHLIVTSFYCCTVLYMYVSGCREDSTCSWQHLTREIVWEVSVRVMWLNLLDRKIVSTNICAGSFSLSDHFCRRDQSDPKLMLTTKLDIGLLRKLFKLRRILKARALLSLIHIRAKIRTRNFVTDSCLIKPTESFWYKQLPRCKSSSSWRYGTCIIRFLLGTVCLRTCWTLRWSNSR